MQVSEHKYADIDKYNPYSKTKKIREVLSQEVIPEHRECHIIAKCMVRLHEGTETKRGRNKQTNQG